MFADFVVWCLEQLEPGNAGFRWPQRKSLRKAAKIRVNLRNLR